MATQEGKSARNKPEDIRPGSSIEEARKMGGKGDFGVPESNVVERTYTSENTKRSNPGGAPARSGADGSRTSGAGGNNSGPGSSSGGDLDPDIVGVGTDRGVAASGRIHEPPGPDDATGTSQDFASGPPSRGRRDTTMPHGIAGSTIQPPDDRTVGAVGADAASRQEGDDSFAAEVSSDEASGRNDAGD